MSAYLSIISGAISLFNRIAGALQQHHDELNGRRAQALEGAQASVKADQDAAQTRRNVDNLTRDQLVDELRRGSVPDHK